MNIIDKKPDNNVKPITSYDGWTMEEAIEITSFVKKNKIKKEEPEFNLHNEIGLELGISEK